MDSTGNLHVAHTYNNTIRKGYPALLILNSGPGFGFNGGQFGFILKGPAGQLVVIEASNDLVSWLPLWTNTLAGALNFSDPQSGVYARRIVVADREAYLLGGLDEGMTREEYAVGFCIGGRQLRRWIHRFNSGGVEELLYRRPRRRGRKRKISGEKFESELLPLVKKLRASDYNPSGRKLWQLAKTKLGCDISYPGMMRTLRREAISFRRPGGQ